MVVGARQKFSIFQANNLVSKKNRALPKFSYRILHYLKKKKKSVRKSQICVDHANHLNLLKSLLKTKMFAEVYNQNLLHTTF